MNVLNRWWPPSLVRRLSLTLLLAFALIWLVQLGLIFLQTKQLASIDQNLQRRAQTLLHALAAVHNTEQVRASMQAADKLLNQNFELKLNPIQLALQLQDAQGRLVYASPCLGAALKPSAGDQQTGQLRWRVAFQRTDNWALWVAEAPWDDFALVQTINQRMWPYVLLSFFLVFIPLAWAMSRGLAPLKLLSKRIARRDAHDLSPLRFHTPYQELNPLAQALERLLGGLRSKIEREHALVHDAAHELRTPLAAVNLHAHALRNAVLPEDRASADLGLQQAVLRASRVIDQLLNLAQLDSEQIPGNTAPLDLAQCLRQEAALAAPAALQKGQDLQVAAPDELYCNLDADAYRAIVQNLLGNAVRYVQAGGQISAVLFSSEAAEAARTICLQVLDNGPGIAADQQHLVFERFHRGNHPETTGSGLGLAIVKQASQRIGATVTLSEGLNGSGLGVTVVLAVR